MHSQEWATTASNDELQKHYNLTRSSEEYKVNNPSNHDTAQSLALLLSLYEQLAVSQRQGKWQNEQNKRNEESRFPFSL